MSKSRPRVQLQDNPLSIAPDPTRATPAAPRTGSVQRTTTPAAATEPQARLAADVPESLMRRFDDMTRQLRQHGGTRLSQKQLPAREVIAALLDSAIGDPENAKDVERVRKLVNAYRSRP